MIDADGLLIDLDGTVVVAGEAIPGAPEAIGALRDRGLPFRFATNATGATRVELAAWLTERGIEAKPDELFTAPVMTSAYLREHHPGARCLLFGDQGAAADLDGVELVDDDPDVIAVAGSGSAFNWENLSRVFRMVLDGAALVAMHRNLVWRTEEGMTLDSGAFVLGLERAAGVEATVLGKPSPDFFRQAVGLLGLDPFRVVMVGDDLDNDVLAAQSLGLTGVLVRTGKFRKEALEASPGAPDHVIDSVAALPDLLA